MNTCGGYENDVIANGALPRVALELFRLINKWKEWLGKNNYYMMDN